MKIKVFDTRVLIKWKQKEVDNLKERGEKILLESPHAVSESELAKKIKENTNVDIPTGEDYPKWEVIRVGNEVRNYQTGDLVLVHANMGTDLPVTEDGKKEFYKLINERDIFGVWDENL